MMALPPYLTDAPSHFNWDVDTGTSKEFNTLIQQLEEHLANNKTMRIQAMLFQSFLYTSKYKYPKPDYVKSRDKLQEALKEIEKLDNKEEKIGYKLVAKCNDAYMDHKLGIHTNTSQNEIENLFAIATALSNACIYSVRAFALSRVGMNKYEEAIVYYSKALDVQPKNTQWLFGLALVTGRIARVKDGAGKSEAKEKERELFKKILEIDENHALAHVFLAYNLVQYQQDEAAVFHAKRATELEPKHLHILTRAGMVLQRAKQPRDALMVFKEALAVGKTTTLYHNMGLAYQDLYNEQKQKNGEVMNEGEQCQQPDEDFITKAINCFNEALEANPSNNMALLDRAHLFEQLRDFKKAQGDFLSGISTTNDNPENKVQFSSAYGAFLVRSLNNTEMASKHFKAAIQCAVDNCKRCPSTNENPKPIFGKGIWKDLEMAKSGYKIIMEEKMQSSEAEEHSEGLIGLAWLHQVFGEHDIAREKYIEYLNCDGKSNDYYAIHQLIICLVQLKDFEGARQKIQDLRNLEKNDLAQVCLIECTLQQGKIDVEENQIEPARNHFIEAVDCGSIEGCKKLADILRIDPDLLSSDFRVNCAKILNCCKMNDAGNDPLCEDIRVLMDLKHAVYGDLRNKHLTLEQVLLENQKSQLTREILLDAAHVIYLSRSMLDRIMISFRQTHYPNISGVCPFFHIQQDTINQSKTTEQVKKEMLKRFTKTCKWDQFDTRFPDLWDFLVKFQPAYPGNTDNWYIALNQLGNRDKHTDKIRYSHYHVPTILNKLTGIFPIPEGQPVYGEPFAPQTQHPGVKYELFDVIEVARKAAIEVERIVAEFHKYM